MGRPSNGTVRRLLRHGRRASTDQVLVCAGDSITRGSVSASYVKRLQSQPALQSVRIVNAGVNGDLAWNVLHRLDGIIECQPDVVTLLVGTNDINATLSARNSALYGRLKRLPQAPSLHWYGECLNAILTRLREQTSARIAVFDIPMIGEDLGSLINDRVNEYNARLSHIAAAHEATVLPLHDTLATLLPPGHRPPPYTGRISEMIRARMPRRLRVDATREPSVGRGLAVLSDHIHLSDVAADHAARLIAEFVATGRREVLS
jgi:lysophospholipase L1-like esterase